MEAQLQIGALEQRRKLSIAVTQVEDDGKRVVLLRVSDEEMKILMIDVVNKTYRALRLLFDDQLGHELVQHLATQDPLPGWNEPVVS